MTSETNSNVASTKDAVLSALRNRSKKARFMTEVAASLGRLNVGKDEMEQALAELQAEGAVIVRDHFCADPHLAGVDLRVAAAVDAAASSDVQAAALHEIDLVWDKWLSDYLANHRCG